MRVHEHYSHWLPEIMRRIANRTSPNWPRTTYALWGVTMWRHVFYSGPEDKVDQLPTIRAHERVHVWQMEKSPVTFFPRYFLHSIWQAIRCGTLSAGYWNNPFEVEAYAKQTMREYDPVIFDNQPVTK